MGARSNLCIGTHDDSLLPIKKVLIHLCSAERAFGLILARRRFLQGSDRDGGTNSGGGEQKRCRGVLWDVGRRGETEVLHLAVEFFVRVAQ